MNQRNIELAAQGINGIRNKQHNEVTEYGFNSEKH